MKALLAVFLLAGCLNAQMLQSITNDTHHSAGPPTYVYNAAQSGNNNGLDTSITLTITSVIGQLSIATCTGFGDNAGVGNLVVSDSAGNTWTDSTFGGTDGRNSYDQFSTVITSGGSNVITCTDAEAAGGVMLFVDTFTSSTGWYPVFGAADAGNFDTVLANNHCSNTAQSDTTQSYELVYGYCSSGASGSTAASGYTSAQGPLVTSNSIRVWTGYLATTTVNLPSLTTTGNWNNWTSIILAYLSN
jgi:hypothetical protein